jgi:hypothetical protein
MAKQNINVGTAANDKKGDSLRAAFVKVNANFTELYTELGLDADTLNIGAFEFTGSVMTTTDSSAITIDQAVAVTSDLTVGGDIIPQTALGGNLGSAAKPWRSLYVSNNTIYIGGTALSVNGAGNLLVNGSLITGGTTSYADLTNKPSIPTSFSKLVSGSAEVVLITEGPEPFTVFPAISTNDQLQIVGSEVGAVSGVLTLTSQTDTLILSNGAGVGGGLKVWTFGSDGALTIPGDIKSEGNINIDINLADSTLRRWQFGEDGALTFPDGTNQTTAFTGSVETFTSPTITANAATLNFNSSAIFALGSNAANITANFTNIPGTAGQTISTTLIITQGATAYIPSAVTINGGGSVTPKWQGGTVPTAVINRVNIVSFTFICTATNTWTVIGSLVDYN